MSNGIGRIGRASSETTSFKLTSKDVDLAEKKSNFFVAESTVRLFKVPVSEISSRLSAGYSMSKGVRGDERRRQARPRVALQRVDDGNRSPPSTMHPLVDPSSSQSRHREEGNGDAFARRCSWTALVVDGGEDDMHRQFGLWRPNSSSGAQ